MAGDIEKFFEYDPFGVAADDKAKLMRGVQSELCQLHYANCSQYRAIIDAIGFDLAVEHDLTELPALPVRLFKEYELLSCPREDVAKLLTSSGTTGQSVSKIYLDKQSVRMQTRVLAHIIMSFVGKHRLPMILLDTGMVKKDRNLFSARGAGIIGFSVFGRDIIYALDDNEKLDINGLISYIDAHSGDTILMYGYTHMIWQYVLNELDRRGMCLNIQDGILFHSGGWKKLSDRQIDSKSYNELVRRTMGNVQIHNYYGMVEQLGSVFVECEYGHMHCSTFSDIIIRRVKDFSVAEFGERGIVELLSVLPTSYPGHVLLTEDEGEILGEDDCPCGRLGKYFKIYGRIKGAEIRGCSDTYERG